MIDENHFPKSLSLWERAKVRETPERAEEVD